ncbi:MAG: hypothetical protein NTX28_00235 [Novosphingobium sp.]|nr:hypothetical protein [Novosphingobium sp.]
MRDDFSDPVDWKGAALCFVLWLAHFTVLWGASSVFPGSAIARWIALLATVVVLAAIVALWRGAAQRQPGKVTHLAMALAVAAVLFGAMPAAIG